MSKRILALILALSALIALFVPGQAETLTVTDMTGRELTFEKPVERIIVMMPGDCEILYAIGAGDLVVGRGEYCRFPAEVLEIASVKSGQETNLEQVIALKPDVVVMTRMAQSLEHSQTLEKVGIPTLVTDAQDIEGVHTAIALLGQVTGKGSQAAWLSEHMRSVFADISAKVGGRAAGSVYYEASPLQWGLWASGSATFMDELGKLAGLANIFDESQGWVEVSEEQVISRNPDYILTTTMYTGTGPTPVEEVMSRVGWHRITAIRENQVLNVDGDIFTVPGPRLMDALSFLYGYLYDSKAAAE